MPPQSRNYEWETEFSLSSEFLSWGRVNEKHDRINGSMDTTSVVDGNFLVEIDRQDCNISFYVIQIKVAS